MELFRFVFGDASGPIAWWQMCDRAVLVFAYALVLYRLLPRKAFGGTAALDIVVTVVLGSSLSRALTANAPLIPVLAATAVLAGLYAALSALAPRSQWLSRLAKGRAIQLVRNGTVDWQAMRRARLGERDLAESLRLKGVSNVAEVAEAFLERNGAISVVKAASPGPPEGGA
ncbi:DUF421 domain-containing protein [Aurantimonas sp. VKM B-3413]|uniref:DUF421 domain-containing protein n=1 Tax=Aurantimonas sp. VKM B-3413 TaxID=2779401 RepID=UPI001E65734A|nr:YetF domain-containing protein [Aurantimonas sp. VKM B-3413]MCB8839770.1 DUF421 domain-containing protein [Aurantimonas sp. VKM B-3413]